MGKLTFGQKGLSYSCDKVEIKVEGAPKCPRCNGRVYFNEEKKALGKTWHVQCFNCYKCKKSLGSTNYNQFNDNLLCTPCFKKAEAAQKSGGAPYTPAYNGLGTMVTNVDEGNGNPSDQGERRGGSWAGSDDSAPAAVGGSSEFTETWINDGGYMYRQAGGGSSNSLQQAAAGATNHSPVQGVAGPRGRYSSLQRVPSYNSAPPSVTDSHEELRGEAWSGGQRPEDQRPYYNNQEVERVEGCQRQVNETGREMVEADGESLSARGTNGFDRPIRRFDDPALEGASGYDPVLSEERYDRRTMRYSQGGDLNENEGEALSSRGYVVTEGVPRARVKKSEILTAASLPWSESVETDQPRGSTMRGLMNPSRIVGVPPGRVAGSQRQSLSHSQSVYTNRDDSECCPKCGKRVYFAEEIKVLKRKWHRLCFKCARCSKTLEPGRFNEHEDALYCSACYSKHFGPHGYGFGGASRAEPMPVNYASRDETFGRTMTSQYDDFIARGQRQNQLFPASTAATNE